MKTKNRLQKYAALTLTLTVVCAGFSANAHEPVSKSVSTMARPSQPPKAPGAFPPIYAPDPNLQFSASKEIVKLAHGPGVVWDGCDPHAVVSGGLGSDTRCGHDFLLPGYVQFLDANFSRCVTRAAATANWPTPVRIYVRHLGTYEDRGVITKELSAQVALSLHAYGRAIDIAGINMYDTQGRVTKFSSHINDYKGSNALFYDEFRQCWKDSMPSTCGKWAETTIGHVKSKMGGNAVHFNHIHTAYPPCAGK